MQAMCDDTTMEHVGWAVGVADCDGVVSLEYFDVDGVSAGTTLPAGWRPCQQGETGATWSPTHYTLTYATPTDVDFTDGQFATLNINGNLTLTGSGYAAGLDVWIKLTETGGASRTITIPSGWVKATTVPTSVAANKTILLHLVAFGATEASVVITAEAQA